MAKVIVKGSIGKVQYTANGWYFDASVGLNDAVFGSKSPEDLIFDLLGYKPENGGDFPYLKSYSDLIKVLEYLNGDELKFLLTLRDSKNIFYFLSLLNDITALKQLCAAVAEKGLFDADLVQKYCAALTPEQEDWLDIHLLRWGAVQDDQYVKWLALTPDTKVMLGNRLAANDITGITRTEAECFMSEAQSDEQKKWVAAVIPLRGSEISARVRDIVMIDERRACVTTDGSLWWLEGDSELYLDEDPVLLVEAIVGYKPTGDKNPKVNSRGDLEMVIYVLTLLATVNLFKTSVSSDIKIGPYTGKAMQSCCRPDEWWVHCTEDQTNDVFFGQNNPVDFIRNIIGYTPGDGHFPVVKTEEDLNKVIEALKGLYEPGSRCGLRPDIKSFIQGRDLVKIGNMVGEVCSNENGWRLSRAYESCSLFFGKHNAREFIKDIVGYEPYGSGSFPLVKTRQDLDKVIEGLRRIN
jgi:hypothetical protein